jgi:hypothetical protein
MIGHHASLPSVTEVVSKVRQARFGNLRRIVMMLDPAAPWCIVGWILVCLETDTTSLRFEG